MVQSKFRLLYPESFSLLREELEGRVDKPLLALSVKRVYGSPLSVGPMGWKVQLPIHNLS
ncbi:hypothetical protein [Neobacillus cucumis]|uniref:hypothetical protein n=1 Tax=Neobacillus cucumis TaxID=1740721 RepID=UPI00285319B9|nr:hypothetical protein [Neobacillus cucumis]MDR4949717.1 hypothetical protein [Neobacillus cucumis]